MSMPPPLPSANPYAAPTARVIDPLQTGTQELADRGTRLLAFIVDFLTYFAVGIAFGIGLAVTAFGRSGMDVGATIAIAVGVAATIALLTINGVLLHRHGQTIAKRMFKIKIVRSDGSRCSLLRVIFARWLPLAVLGVIPFLKYIVFLADSLMIFRDDYRCLHDQIADTVVVKA